MIYFTLGSIVFTQSATLLVIWGLHKRLMKIENLEVKDIVRYGSDGLRKNRFDL